MRTALAAEHYPRSRVNAEARRLLLYTTKSAKEIAYLLGYEDTAAFSRFFAKMNGESITGFRQREKQGIISNISGIPAIVCPIRNQTFASSDN